jgi:integrase
MRRFDAASTLPARSSIARGFRLARLATGYLGIRQKNFGCDLSEFLDWQEDAAMIGLLVGYGLRPSEVVSLRLDQLDCLGNALRGL